MSEDTLNPYAPPQNIFDANRTPSYAEKKLAQSFFSDLEYHGGSDAVVDFLQYAATCAENNEMPVPRQHIIYQGGKKFSGQEHTSRRIISEAEIFDEVSKSFELEKNEDRRSFLKATGIVLAAAGASVAGIKLGVNYLFSDKVSDETRNKVNENLGATAGVTGAGLVAVLCGSLYSLHKLNKEEREGLAEKVPPEAHSFATKLKEIRAESNKKER